MMWVKNTILLLRVAANIRPQGGETDWKVLGIDVDDELALLVNCELHPCWHECPA